MFSFSSGDTQVTLQINGARQGNEHEETRDIRTDCTTPEQPAPTLDCPHGVKVFPYVH